VSAHHTMFKLACLVGTLAAGSVEAFAPLRPVARPFSRTHGRVWLSPEEAEKAAKIKQIMAEEAMDPETMAMTAERMKEMSPQDLDTMIGEVAGMDDLQKEQLKAMVGDLKPNYHARLEQSRSSSTVVRARDFAEGGFDRGAFASLSSLSRRVLSFAVNAATAATAAATTITNDHGNPRVWIRT